MTVEKNNETKICKKCGRELPLSKFRLVQGKYYNPYYLGQCKECEYLYQRGYLEEKNKIEYVDNLEHLVEIQYKNIIPERILDIDSLDILPIGTDEIFVKLMDYKDAWLSNYGRIIKYSGSRYHLMQGSCDANGTLRYTLSKSVYIDGEWKYKIDVVYAQKVVVEEFIVNPDKANNIYVWHSGADKEDNYYRNLYPLNKEQYRIVKNHFNKTGDDSEQFILNVINDIRFKPDNWSSRCMIPTVTGVGYWGRDDVDCKSESYLRWSDMLQRCYNKKLHERSPQYIGCEVCQEWKNYCNFKLWWDKHKPNYKVDLDKDILFKGNKVYSPETCAFVPHEINTLFVNGKACRGELPVGVYYDTEKGKYRANMAFMGRSIKLGTFDTADEAFARYKEDKEDFVKDIAEQYRKQIPQKVYKAMLNWKVEITD